MRVTESPVPLCTLEIVDKVRRLMVPCGKEMIQIGTDEVNAFVCVSCDMNIS